MGDVPLKTNGSTIQEALFNPIDAWAASVDFDNLGSSVDGYLDAWEEMHLSQVPKPKGLPNLVFHHMNRIQLSVIVDTKTVRRCAVPRKHLRDLLKGKVVDIDITYITVSKLDHDGGTVSKQREAPPMDTQALLQYFSPLRVVSCTLGHVTVNGVKVPKSNRVVADDAVRTDDRGLSDDCIGAR